MPAGRPVKFKTAEEMQIRIDAYFESLFRPALRWDKATSSYIEVLDHKTGEQVREQFKPATVTGLALSLGMTREGLIHYAAKSKKFADTISRAKMRVQEYAETRLFDREGGKGAEFSLRCNFGWKEPVETPSASQQADNILIALQGNLRDIFPSISDNDEAKKEEKE